MDQMVSKYFCIFCDDLTLESMTDAYNHYKGHTSRTYYCPECDRDQHCDKDHSDDLKVSSGSDSEDGLIEMWIERFLAFQSEIIGKTYGDFFRTTKLFSGCVVCETFLRLCANNQIELNNKQIQWSSNQSASNEGRHVCSHLRYYPYECLKCENAGKYHKKCDLSEITRHIRGSHSMSVKNPNFESSIKSVKIRKLESLIENIAVTRRETAGQTLTPFVKQNKTPPPPTSPVRSSKRILNQTPKSVPVVSEPVVKRPKVETKMIVIKNENNVHNLVDNDLQKSSTYSTKTSFGQTNGSMTIKMNIRKQKPELQKQSVGIHPKTIIQKMKTNNNIRPEIVFKPISKTYSNPVITQSNRFKQNKLISGDQIIIKTVTERPKPSTLSSKPISLIKKSTPHLTKKSQSLTLSQQFSDMMSEEEDNLKLDPIPNNLVQNMSYFCVFCPENISDKDEAFRHIQRHVDYLPIVCLTCGEGLTDIQSFMKHHRELHPTAVKGKYKKKEQPLLEKWISSFLYSQATIIRSFPPREACPVCDVIFTRAEVQRMKPRRCTVNRKIDHLYRHLSYLPYECILCRQSGQEFLVAYFESKAHSHIKLKHPEIDDNEERWLVFQKTISIPKLDEFIENYLGSFGISMQFERRPVKKNKFGSPSEASSDSIADSSSQKFDDRSLNLNMIFSDIIEPKTDTNKDVKEDVNEEDIDEEDLNEEEEEEEINEEEEDMDLIEMDEMENKKESPVLNEFNNNSNDSNIVVNVSPINLLDKNASEDNEEEEEELYFCVFCSQNQYFTKMEAYAHYGSHLDYNPVLCKICSKKFADVDHLMTHHQSVHKSQDNVDYEIREDQILVKWVNEFLESQKSIKKVMPCSCSYKCPVCLKLIGNELSDISMPCAQHNDVVFSVHIHKHLNYFPYECLICKRNNKSVRVPNLDLMAMNHLKKHNIVSASMSQVVRSFPKTLVISQLEKLIGDSVHRKRLSEKKTRSESANGFQPTIVNNNSLQLNIISIPDGQPSTSRSAAKTQHIRLQGGRVINLPPKSRLEAELSTNGSTGGQNKNAVCCMHCRQSFADRKVLRLHHKQSHPGKPILCTKSI